MQRSAQLSLLAGGLATLMALKVLWGWATGEQHLRVVVDQLPPMVPNTGVALVGAGLSLMLLAVPAPARWRALLARVCAVLPLVIGTVTVVEYVGRVGATAFDVLLLPTSFDVLLLPTEPRAADRYPGRPAANTATALASLGAALWFLSSSRKRFQVMAQLLAAAVSVISLIALAGYVYRAPALFGPLKLLPFTGMAISTAFALQLLAMGILVARPDVGVVRSIFSSDMGGLAARRLLLAASSVPVLGILAARQAREKGLDENVTWSVLAVVVLMMAVALIIVTAQRLNALDRQRQRWSARLQQAHARLTEAHADLMAVNNANIHITNAICRVSELGLPGVLKVIGEEARTITRAQFAAVGLTGEGDERFNPWVWLGMRDDVARAIGRPPRPVGVLGVVAKDGQVVRVPDIRKHAAYRGLPPGHPPITSFLGVPIVHGDVLSGNLFLANCQVAPEFSSRDEQIARALAARAAGAISAAQAYRTVEDERTWLQNVIDQMPEGVLLLRADGALSRFNQVAGSFQSPPAHDVHAFKLHVTDSQGVTLPWDATETVQAVRRGEKAGEQWRIRRPDGTEVVVLVSGMPVVGSHGEKIGATVVFQDISALKQMEKLREEWSSVIAHDLRQPLGVIGLTASLLRRRAEQSGETHLQQLDRIVSAVGGMERLVGDLLDATILEARRMTLNLEDLHIVGLVRDHVANNDQVQLETPSQDVEVRADARRVEQILSNLLSNAVKYGAPGSPIVVAISVGENEVEITVTNHGPGFSPEEKKHLFERYHRTSSARRSGIRGTGLGLYIVKGIVEAHGGRIWAESTPGQLTSFHFTLPRPHAAPRMPPPTHLRPGTEHPTRPDPSTLS